jgi:hypothetical protein
MALNFPNNPALNDTFVLGTDTWSWSGIAWQVRPPTLETSASILSGTAARATRLATPRTINGVAFDGTADIEFTNNSLVNGAKTVTLGADGKLAVPQLGKIGPVNDANSYLTFNNGDDVTLAASDAMALEAVGGIRLITGATGAGAARYTWIVTSNGNLTGTGNIGTTGTITASTAVINGIDLKQYVDSKVWLALAVGL